MHRSHRLVTEKPAELNLADDGTNDEDPDVAGDGGVVLYLSKGAVMLMLEMALWYWHVLNQRVCSV